MLNRAFLKNKSAVFIGSTLMLDNCLKIASNKFRKISVISDDKIIYKKYKKKFRFIKIDDLYNMSFDYLFSVLNEKIIPKKILKNIEILALNFHDGPLPRYAGLYSSTWAILNGEKKHGACWHKLVEDLDTGEVYQSVKFKIHPTDSALNIDFKGILIGIKLFKKLISKLDKNKNKGVKQNLKERIYYGKKDFYKIDNNGFFDFNKGHVESLRLFRALNFSKQKKNYISCPKILTSKGPLLVKNLNVEKKTWDKKHKVGKILSFKNSIISVVCRDAILNIQINYSNKENFNKKILPKLTKKLCTKFAKFGLDINYRKIRSAIKVNNKFKKHYNSKQYENKIYEIYKIVKKTFGKKISLPSVIKKRIAFIEDLGLGHRSNWDSIGHIRFLFNVEKKYKIKINETNVHNFNNVKSIANYLKKKIT